MVASVACELETEMMNRDSRRVRDLETLSSVFNFPRVYINFGSIDHFVFV